MNAIICILIVNAVLTVGFLIYQFLWKKNSDRSKAILLAFFFLTCPGIGMAGILASSLAYHLRPNRHLDITGISFLNEKKGYQRREDYQESIDITPLDDVLRISGIQQKREKLLQSIKSDINASMATYSAAVLSEDSEVSHYAAAMLSKTRDSFARSLNRLAQEYDSDRTNQEITLAYLNAELQYLASGIRLFLEERRKHQYSVVQLCENLYHHHPESMTEELFAQLVNTCLELEEQAKAREWLSVFVAAFPKSENAYLAKLRFYYQNGERELFFESLSALKFSGIPVGAETIDFIRFFSAGSPTTS